MTEDNYLRYFITEDIFIVKNDNNEPEVQDPADEKPSAPAQEAPVLQQKVEEPAPPVVTPTTPKPEAPASIHELAIWTPPLTSTDRELLVKILGAIKKDFNKAHLMEGINSYSPHYKTLLCFGYDKELELKLGTNLALYVPTDHASQQILCSVSPADLQADATQKKHLWEALQKMFL